MSTESSIDSAGKNWESNQPEKIRCIVCVHGGMVTEVKASTDITVQILDYDLLEDEESDLREPYQASREFVQLEQDFESLPFSVY